MHGAERVDEISRGHVDTLSISAGKLRSSVWEHFTTTETLEGKPSKAKCNYCIKVYNCLTTKNGTSSMKKHLKKEHPMTSMKKPGAHPPNPSSTSDAIENATLVEVGSSSNRKRKRTDKEPAQTTADNTHTRWDKAELSDRIKKTTSQLQSQLLDIQWAIKEVLEPHGSSSTSSSNHHQPSTTSDQHVKTSSLIPREVYGRVAEKNTIKKIIAENNCDRVTVLPIVGIAGVGKTTLAQSVYNDPDVRSQFHHKMWVWVSRKFDAVMLTREMLYFLSGSPHKNERHEGVSSLAKLQEILKDIIEYQSKSFLLILDNVWDSMDDHQWRKLVCPLVSSQAKGNLVLVTTRNLSVARTLGTRDPIKLGALDNDDMWLLLKSCALSGANYEGNQSLSIVGRQISQKLKGNPLAAETAGALLRKKLSIDYWRSILQNEDWKSMELSGGIMVALKLSYDQLPYHLQQCFSYCSIFPDSYQFLCDELVGFWISQGFVKCDNSSRRLEDIGLCYLIDLVNLGFFEEVKREESCQGSQVLYAICGLMHDFVVMVSGTDCASIDGLECNKMPLTLRHLSIVTSSAYKKDQHGGISREQKFEVNLRNAIKSVSKLRTLVLLGHYDSYFLQLFEDIFREAHNLRLLHMSTISPDFLRPWSDEVDVAFPQVLSKLYHLRVLNVGSYTDPNIPDGISNLVSLWRLLLHKGVYASIATMDNMTSLQELHDLKFQISSNFEITQPEFHNVKTLKEVYEVVCERNELLEKHALTWVELMLMDGSGPSSEPSMGIARESCQHLKVLQIFGDSGATSFTSLLSLQLYNCGEWQRLPSLERFPFLIKLKLSNLQKLTEILVPSLEELVLSELPELKRCSCTSVAVMNSSLRALQIEDCQALIKFDLFENNDKFEIEERPWLPGLRKLILRDCPHLKVLNPLPPSTNLCELLVKGVSTLPYMEASSSEELRIGYTDEECYVDESSDELRILDDKILAFHNLGNLKSMKISCCRYLRSFSFRGFSHLVFLESLEILCCKKLFPSDVMQEHTNRKTFPSLKSLSITSCAITGKWLSLMLQDAPVLEKLGLVDCQNITTVLLPGEEENSSDRDGHLHVPLNYLSSLIEITVRNCYRLTLDGIKEGFSVFTSLKKLEILRCHEVHIDGRWLLPTSVGELAASIYSAKKLQPCFSRDITSLKKLTVWCNPGLQSLHLNSCTALESLKIEYCRSETTLEGLQFLGSLKHLAVYDCPSITEPLKLLGLETLEASHLTTSLCELLTSLQLLKLRSIELNDEDKSSLLLLKSLEGLEFYQCCGLLDTLASLHALSSLKRLRIHECQDFSSLPEAGLPRSLEQLEIYGCNKDIADQCRNLATSKLNVIIQEVDSTPLRAHKEERNDASFTDMPVDDTGAHGTTSGKGNPNDPFVIEAAKGYIQTLTKTKRRDTVVKVPEPDADICTAQMLGAIIKNEWLCGAVINAYCKHIQMRAPRPDRYIASTWVSKWLLDRAAGNVSGGRKNNAENLQKRTKIVSRVMDEYFGREKAYFPMNVNDNHWLTVIMHTTKKEFQVLNSTGPIDENVRNMIGTLRAEIAKDIANANRQVETKFPDVSAWPIMEYDMPRQTDGVSCALFVMRCVEHWDGEEWTSTFDQQEINASRGHILAELIFSEANTLLKVKQKVLKLILRD